MRGWKLLTFLAVAALVTACGAGQPAPSSSGTGRGAVTGSPAETSPGSNGPGGRAGSSPAPSPAPGLVSGHVTAGPITPVSRPGQPNTRPVAGARVEALRGTDVAAVTSTDRAGYYQVPLPPGTYVIAVTYPGLRPAPMTRTAVVSAGRPETLDFVLDTGIR